MNKDIIRSKWTEIGWEVKERWGKLSDYDLTEVNGDPERLLALLYRRYGVSERYAREEIGEFLAKYVDNSDEGIPRA
jgi:uncharacterized protein YjbJ (UPF0337 family)